MNGFFWTSGHLGWGIFAIVVFTALWCILSDLIWRLRNIRIHQLTIGMVVSWVVGILFILLGFHFGHH